MPQIRLPKIENIEITKPYHMARLHHERCTRNTKSTGTSYFSDKKYQCSRLARFSIDGVLLCTQHAGEEALRYLIKQQLEV